jgi:peptide/nickel transport system permease protein
MNALLHRPVFYFTSAVCLLLVLVAVLAPWIAPHDPMVGDLTERLMPPFWGQAHSTTHILGTDVLGRDIFSRLLYGARVSLAVCLLSISIAGVVGSVLGLLAGYLGGWIDAVIMRLVDIAISLPVILLALLFGVLFGPSFTNIVIIISLILWSQFARMARGETLRIRQSAYVDLARAAGCSGISIMLRHILPNVAGALIVLATLQVGTVIIMEASLSFLGVGVPPPTPAWGSMIAEGRSYVISAWWICMFPGIAVLLTVMAVNVLGDEMADLINPALRSEIGA